MLKHVSPSPSFNRFEALRADDGDECEESDWTVYALDPVDEAPMQPADGQISQAEADA